VLNEPDGKKHATGKIVSNAIFVNTVLIGIGHIIISDRKSGATQRIATTGKNPKIVKHGTTLSTDKLDFFATLDTDDTTGTDDTVGKNHSTVKIGKTQFGDRFDITVTNHCHKYSRHNRYFSVVVVVAWSTSTRH
jgi:hypothetical protein